MPEARTSRRPSRTAVAPAPATPEPTPTEEKETPVTTVEKPRTARKTRTHVNLNPEIDLGAVEAVTNAVPFARGSYELPEDHPINKLFQRSVDEKVALAVPTNDPASVVALLRRVASQRKQGVRIDPQTRKHLEDPDNVEYNGTVTFQAKEKRTAGVGRKPKSE